MTSIGAAYMPTALVLPSILGAIVAILFTRAMFAGGKRLDLSTFFMASAVLLLFISAGLAAHGSYKLQKAGMFGTWACYGGGCNDDGGSGVVSVTEYTPIAGYYPASDVTQHSRIDLDVAAASSAASAADWDLAWVLRRRPLGQVSDAEPHRAGLLERPGG